MENFNQNILVNFRFNVKRSIKQNSEIEVTPSGKLDKIKI